MSERCDWCDEPAVTLSTACRAHKSNLTPTTRERRLRTYVDQLVIERETLRKLTRRLEDETVALRAQLARQELKNQFRGMEGM